MKTKRLAFFLVGMVIFSMIGLGGCQQMKITATPTQTKIIPTSTPIPTNIPQVFEGIVLTSRSDFFQGVSPDMSFATGVGPNIEGNQGQSLEITAALQAAINGQGFIPILADQTHLNIHQDGKIGLGVTEKVADRDNPAIVYHAIEQINGQWAAVVPGALPLTNNQGLVAFGGDNNQPAEAMISAVPNMFGNLEAVNIIVKDPTKIPEALKAAGYNFYEGTVFTALIDPSTGEIMSLVPAIHSGTIVITSADKGKLVISVADGITNVFDLTAPESAFVPPMSADVQTWLKAHPDFNFQEQLKAAGLNVTPDQVKIGPDGVLKIYDQAGTKLLYLYDKNNTLVSFEAKKAEALSMVSIKLDAIDDFKNIPTEDSSKFDDGGVQAEFYWLMDNVLPPMPENLKLPNSWSVSDWGNGFRILDFDHVTESEIILYRFVGAFFVMQDGMKYLRIGLQFGGKDQLVLIEFDNPDAWNNIKFMNYILAAIHSNGNNSNSFSLVDSFLTTDVEDLNTNVGKITSARIAGGDQLVQYWIKNHQLPEGSDETVFGVAFTQ